MPSQTLQVAAVPRTLSGKKMELPIKKLLLGADPAQVMNRDAIATFRSFTCKIRTITSIAVDFSDVVILALLSMIRI